MADSCLVCRVISVLAWPTSIFRWSNCASIRCMVVDSERIWCRLKVLSEIKRPGSCPTSLASIGVTAGRLLIQDATRLDDRKCADMLVTLPRNASPLVNESHWTSSRTSSCTYRATILYGRSFPVNLTILECVASMGCWSSSDVPGCIAEVLSTRTALGPEASHFPVSKLRFPSSAVNSTFPVICDRRNLQLLSRIDWFHKRKLVGSFHYSLLLAIGISTC